jgi:hypothetical protein
LGVAHYTPDIHTKPVRRCFGVVRIPGVDMIVSGYCRRVLPYQKRNTTCAGCGWVSALHATACIVCTVNEKVGCRLQLMNVK